MWACLILLQYEKGQQYADLRDKRCIIL